MNEDKNIKGKRLNTVLDDDEMVKFENIRSWMSRKYGKTTATDSAVIKASIIHFSDHVDRNELE